MARERHAAYIPMSEARGITPRLIIVEILLRLWYDRRQREGTALERHPLPEHIRRVSAVCLPLS